MAKRNQCPTRVRSHGTRRPRPARGLRVETQFRWRLELNSVQWPGYFQPIIVEGQYRDPPSTKAVTFFASTEAKRAKTTEEAFKAVIEKFDCIVY